MNDARQYEPYRVYLADMSYFSGKLEVYMRYRELPFDRVEASMGELLEEVYPGTGLMKVPVVRMANGQWLKDTTPMLFWFDRLYAEPSIIPRDPYMQFISRLVEDYADEWLWRPALYYRWMYRQDRRLLGDRIASEVMKEWPLPTRFLGWYFGHRQIRVHLKGDGMRPHNEGHIQDTYLKLLDCLQAILDENPFLLGSHPTLVDFGFFASMFRHFGLDPTPARIMRKQAPAVYEWLARMWNAQVSRLGRDVQISNQFDSAWDHVLEDIRDVYLPYLAANAEAWSRKARGLDFETGDVRYPDLPVSQYRVWCRGELQRAYAALPEDIRGKVNSRFGGDGIDALMQAHGIVESGLESEFDLPLGHSYEPARGMQKLKLFLNGTPQDMPAGVRRIPQG